MYSLYLHLNVQLCVYAWLYLRIGIPYSLCIIYDRYSLRRVRGRPSTSSTPMIVVSIFINVVIAALFLLLLLFWIYCCAKLRFRPTVSVFSSAAGSVVSAIRVAPLPLCCPLSVINHLDFIYNNYAQLKKRCWSGQWFHGPLPQTIKLSPGSLSAEASLDTCGSVSNSDRILSIVCATYMCYLQRARTSLRSLFW